MAITLAVATTGTDVTQPGRVDSGDLSATPFLTLRRAISVLPQNVRDGVYINMGAGTFSGAIISGFSGGRITEQETIGFYINGTYSAVTPTTGVASGTAGSGTNSTTLVKPTGAANWTASDAALLGKLVKITSGGGAGLDPVNSPVVRPIKAITTSNITVDTVSGMDSTTVFSLVSPATTISEILNDTVPLRISYNSAPLVIRGLKFTSSSTLDNLIKSAGNDNITIDGCLFDFNTTDSGVLSDKDGTVLVSNCSFAGGADMTVQYCARYVEGRALFANVAGIIEFEKSMSGKIQLYSLYSIGVAFSAAAMNYLEAEIYATQAEDTCVRLESINYFEAVGTNKLSGGSNGVYGIETSKSGFYSLTGSTITGVSGDVLFMGTAVTWANLASATYGLAEWHTGGATAYATVAKSLKYGNYLFDGSIDVSGRFLMYGYCNQSANLSAAVLNSATPYNMETQGVRGVLEASSTNAAAIVVLPSNAAICGVVVTVVNVGTQILTVQAPSGGVLTGTATVTNGTAGMFVSLNTNSGKDFLRIV